MRQAVKIVTTKNDFISSLSAVHNVSYYPMPNPSAVMYQRSKTDPPFNEQNYYPSDQSINSNSYTCTVYASLNSG